MAKMKIGDLNQTYSTANFEFPNNPINLKVPLPINDTIANIDYGRMHVFIGAGGVGVRDFVLQGTMKGATRYTDFNALAKEIHDNNIKKFWFNSTDFYYVKGRSIDQTYDGNKTNFIDYVAMMSAIYPYKLSTERTFTATITGSTETRLRQATPTAVGKFENQGSAPAYVEWEIVNVTGNSITEVQIGDAWTGATAQHFLVWKGTLPSGGGASSKLNIRIFKYDKTSVRGSIKSLRLGFAEINGVSSGTLQVIGGAMPQVYPDETDQNFSIRLLNNNNTTTIKATWNDCFV